MIYEKKTDEILLKSNTYSSFCMSLLGFSVQKNMIIVCGRVKIWKNVDLDAKPMQLRNKLSIVGPG